MKLKKRVKMFLILLLLGIMGSTFYTFNRWFFMKYKDVGQKEVEEHKKQEVETKNNPVTEEENPDINDSQKEEDVKTLKEEKKGIKPSEIYYCSDGDTLDGKECITKIEVDAMQVQEEDNRDYVELQFNIPLYTLRFQSAGEDVTEEDVKLYFKEMCETSLKGTFGLSTDNSDDFSCFYTTMEENISFSYICLDGFTLSGTKCFKEERIPAKVRYGCPEGTIQDGIYCVQK